MTEREIRATAANGMSSPRFLIQNQGQGSSSASQPGSHRRPLLDRASPPCTPNKTAPPSDDPDAEECQPPALREEQDQEGGDDRERRERPEVCQRKDARDCSGERKPTPVPILHADEQYGQNQ